MGGWCATVPTLLGVRPNLSICGITVPRPPSLIAPRGNCNTTNNLSTGERAPLVFLGQLSRGSELFKKNRRRRCIHTTCASFRVDGATRGGVQTEAPKATAGGTRPRRSRLHAGCSRTVNGGSRSTSWTAPMPDRRTRRDESMRVSCTVAGRCKLDPGLKAHGFTKVQPNEGET